MPSDHDWMLRTAAAHDAAAMRRLAHDAYEVYTARIGREPAPMTSDYETIAASGAAVLACDGQHLLGMLVYRPEPGALLVENIAVAPTAQGKGLGSVLLAEAERIARGFGTPTIRLYTNAAMTENLAFYPRRSYVETHRATEDGYERVHLVKRLAP